VMNLYLIPMYGITGAAFSTGFIYVFYNFARSYYIYRVYGLHPFKWTQFRIIALFVVLLVLIEGASHIFIHGQHFTTLQNLIILLIKWFLILMLFLLPVVTLNLESESSRYFKKVMSGIRTRVRS
jgi:O-antigen/teichoic acid export membrane protein